MAECAITLLPQGWCAHCTGSQSPDELREGESPPFYGAESKSKARREIGAMAEFARKHSQRRHLKQRRKT